MNKILKFIKKIYKNFQENKLKLNKKINKIKTLEADIKSKQSNENQKTQLNKEMKYLFPSSEVDFKNFATDAQNYSTIIHHHENMVNSIKNFLKNENIDKTINYIETLNSFNLVLSVIFIFL